MEKQEFFLFCSKLKLSKYDLEHLVGTQRWDMERDFRKIDNSFRPRYDYAFVKIQFLEEDIYIIKKNRQMLLSYYEQNIRKLKYVTEIIDGREIGWIDCSPDVYPCDPYTSFFTTMRVPVSENDLKYYKDFSVELNRFRSIRSIDFSLAFPHFWHQLTFSVSKSDVVKFVGLLNCESRKYFSEKCNVLCPPTLFDTTGHVLSICNLHALINIYKSIKHDELLQDSVSLAFFDVNNCITFLEDDLVKRQIIGLNYFNNKVIVARAFDFCEITVGAIHDLRVRILECDNWSPRIKPSSLQTFQSIHLTSRKEAENFKPSPLQTSQSIDFILRKEAENYCAIDASILEFAQSNLYCKNPCVAVECVLSNMILNKAMTDLKKIEFNRLILERRYGALCQIWQVIRKKNPLHLLMMEKLVNCGQLLFYFTRSGKIKSNLSKLKVCQDVDKQFVVSLQDHYIYSLIGVLLVDNFWHPMNDILRNRKFDFYLKLVNKCFYNSWLKKMQSDGERLKMSEDNDVQRFIVKLNNLDFFHTSLKDLEKFRLQHEKCHEFKIPYCLSCKGVSAIVNGDHSMIKAVIILNLYHVGKLGEQYNMIYFKVDGNCEVWHENCYYKIFNFILNSLQRENFNFADFEILVTYHSLGEIFQLIETPGVYNFVKCYYEVRKEIEIMISKLNYEAKELSNYLNFRSKAKCERKLFRSELDTY